MSLAIGTDNRHSSESAGRTSFAAFAQLFLFFNQRVSPIPIIPIPDPSFRSGASDGGGKENSVLRKGVIK